MTTVIVMAHQGTEETCRRHLPFWRQQGNVIFFSPADARVEIDEAPIWSVGHRGHHSPGANDRFLAMLRMCAGTDADHFVVHEYDSICFEPVAGIPEDHLAGIAYRDERPDRKFVGTTFVHPPLFFSRPVLIALITALSSLPEQEENFWDRWIGLACERAGIPIYNLRDTGLGYSENTIAPNRVGLAIEAVKRGAVCFHGVKSELVFDALKAAGHW